MEKAIVENPDKATEIYIDYLKDTEAVNQRLLAEINRLVDNDSGLTDLERAVIKANERYELKNDCIRNLSFNSSTGRFSGQKEVREAIAQYYQAVFSAVNETELSSLWCHSWAFIDYAYFNSLVRLTLPAQIENRSVRVPFSELYDLIMDNHQGVFRDRLIAATFMNFGSAKEIPNGYYQRALEKLSDREAVKLMEKLMRERGVGMDGFPFHLPDTTGRDVSFSDFEGKVVVLDFWFTGCQGCLSLAKAMRPVHDYFKGNQDVVFVNIAIDADKDTWMKSVRSGKYDYPGSIALFAGGQGDKNAVIKHYNILAYPTVIVFDRKGRVAHFNPTGPFSESERRSFIKRIEELF